MDWPLNWISTSWFAIHWLPMDWLVYILPQRWLISVCHHAETRHAIFNEFGVANSVIRISNNIVVKYGYSVKRSEAATQQYAAQKLNPRGIVRVPHVYRYFQVYSCIRPAFPRPMCYLFMEYIPGPMLEQEGPDLSQDTTVNAIYERLAKAVSELNSVAIHENNGIPGPINSGGKPLDGYLFGDDGTKVAISSVDDLNNWLNKRLKIIKKAIDLHPYPFTLCHLDFSRRNIKVTSDYNKNNSSNYSICLLDWGFAGFYPRCFELASASCIKDRDYAYELCLFQAINDIMKPREQEKIYVDLLKRALAGSSRYTL